VTLLAKNGRASKVSSTPLLGSHLSQVRCPTGFMYSHLDARSSISPHLQMDIGDWDSVLQFASDSVDVNFPPSKPGRQGSVPSPQLATPPVRILSFLSAFHLTVSRTRTTDHLSVTHIPMAMFLSLFRPLFILVQTYTPSPQILPFCLPIPCFSMSILKSCSVLPTTTSGH